MKDLYNENFKTLKKRKLKEKRRYRMEDLPCSWVGRIHIKKLILLLKLIYRFNVKPMKISILYFICLEKQAKNSFWTTEDQGKLSTPKRKEHSWGTTVANLSFHYRAIVTKTAWHWHKPVRPMKLNRGAWKGSDKAMPT